MSKYYFLFIVTLSLIFPRIIFANTYYDEFDSNSSLGNYTVNLNGGHVEVDSGSLKLSAAFGNRYPYLLLDKSNLSGDFQNVIIKFKYESIGLFGAGISLDDNFPSNNSLYDIGHNSVVWTWNWGNPPFARIGYYPFTFFDLNPQNQFHEIRLERVSGGYLFLLDGVYVNTIATTKIVSTLWLGNPHTTNSPDSWPTIWIDEIRITDSQNSPPFPFLSQKDPDWADHEYDSASDWAPLLQQGIDRWGCALTSAAMILQKYGLSEVNPDNLNTWLQNEDDGYIGPGFVNWLAITRYAKGKLPGEKKSLEFTRSYDPTDVELPAILGLPGHFVVAHEEDLTSWKINDPALSVGDTNLLKTSTVRSVNRFIPSNTDLSYMLFVTKSGVSGTMTSPASIPVSLTWLDEYLTDDVGGSVLGPHLSTAMYGTPPSGEYHLTIINSNITPSEFEIYLYDVNGNFVKQIITAPPGESEYLVVFDRLRAQDNHIIVVDIIPPSTPTLLTPTNNSYHIPAGLKLDWSDVTDLSLPVRYEYQLESVSGTTTASELDISALADNAFSWKVRACDVADNCSGWSDTWSFTIDSLPPSSDFALPTISNNWDGNIVGTASDNMSGVANIELIIDPPIGLEFVITAIGTTDWSYTIPVVTDGTYTVRSRATDGAGNVESELTQRTIVVDTVRTESPVIRFVRGWFNRIELNWRPVENAVSYKIFYGTKRDQLTNVVTTTNTHWLSGELRVGQYYAAVKAIDLAGNESALSAVKKVEVHKKFDMRNIWDII